MICHKKHDERDFGLFGSAMLVSLLFVLLFPVGCSRNYVVTHRDKASMKRVALMIGNSVYKKGPLPTAGTNVQDMKQWIDHYDYQSFVYQDLSKVKMEAALEDFEKNWLARLNDVIFIYYSGRAVQKNGTNYLLPGDIKLTKPGDIEQQGINLDRFLQTIDSYHHYLAIVILDVEALPLQHMEQFGLTAGMAPIQAPGESIVVVSGQPGQFLPELPTERNSLFTRALLDRFRQQPDEPILDSLKTVQSAVAKSTQNKQVPWILDNKKYSPYRHPYPVPESTPPTDLKTVVEPLLQMEFVYIQGGTYSMGAKYAVPDDKWIYPVVLRFPKKIDLDTGEYIYEPRLIDQKYWELAMGYNPIPGKEPLDYASLNTNMTKELGEEHLERLYTSVSNVRGKDVKKLVAKYYRENNANLLKRYNEVFKTHYTEFPPNANYRVEIRTNEDPLEDEVPSHSVRLNSFYVGRKEVTQNQWLKIMGYNPSRFQKSDDHPVENVSFGDVKEFIKRLNRQTGKNIYRLPTEAEWEYICRNGRSETIYPWGNYNPIESNIPPSNFLDSDYVLGRWLGPHLKTYKDGFSNTAPVGQFPPNALGIQDLGGNVGEWVADWYDKRYYIKSAKTNPQGPDSGKVKSIRGGSWMDTPQNLRCTRRNWASPGAKTSGIGFRLVRIVE